MSPRYRTHKELVINIHDYITPEEAEEYPSWTKFDDVADVTDQDLTLYGIQQARKSLVESLKHAQALVNPRQADSSRSGVRFDLTSKKRPCGEEPESPFTALAKPPAETHPSQTSPTNRITPSSTSSHPPSGISESSTNRLVVPLGTLLEPQTTETPSTNIVNDEINLRRLQLADLIPTDDSILDLNSNEVYITTLNGEESDSVSYTESSSDDS